MRHQKGVSLGLTVGVTLWAVLFLPLATFGIQPRLDAYLTSAPNAYVNNIVSHFAGLYPLIVGGVVTISPGIWSDLGLDGRKNGRA